MPTADVTGPARLISLRQNCLQFLTFAMLTIGLGGHAAAYTINGFELGDALIPEALIKHGGPPRDGIPAIDKPTFIAASDATNLKPETRVMGVYRNGVAKAYPVLIMNWHEIC